MYSFQQPLEKCYLLPKALLQNTLIYLIRGAFGNTASKIENSRLGFTESVHDER